MPTPAITLPGGWGFPTGYQLVAGSAIEQLPELPLLKVLRGQQRNDAIVEELVKIPAFREIRQRDLMKKYGLPSSTANVVLQRALRHA
ncbi:hypothetical protein [Lysobacter fragariae]